MSCHTHFNRPIDRIDNLNDIIKKELPILQNILKLLNQNQDAYDKNHYAYYDEFYYYNLVELNKMLEMINDIIKNIDVIQDFLNISDHYYANLFSIMIISKYLNRDVFIFRNKFYIELDGNDNVDHCDIFRVRDFSGIMIDSLQTLETYLQEKEYQKLNKHQLEKINDFWKKYPDGVITFE